MHYQVAPAMLPKLVDSASPGLIAFLKEKQWSLNKLKINLILLLIELNVKAWSPMNHCADCSNFPLNARILMGKVKGIASSHQLVLIHGKERAQAGQWNCITKYNQKMR